MELCDASWYFSRIMGSGTPSIPSYALYGEPFGGSCPDVLHCESIVARSGLYDWIIDPHRHHGLHQFLLLREGGVTVSSDGEHHHLLAPAAMMNAPGIVHGFRFVRGTEGWCVTASNAMVLRAVSGNTALLEGFRRSQYLGNDVVGADLPDLSANFDGLAKDYAIHREGRAEALLCRLGLIALWFSRSAGRRPGPDTPSDDVVDRFLALLEVKYRQQLPVDYYARRLGITASHLTRLCRRQLGLSASGVIQDRLMLEAKRGLVYTQVAIRHISNELGFSDPSYFSRFFSQRCGVTPKSFRARSETE